MLMKRPHHTVTNSQQAELCSQIIAFLPNIADGEGEAYKSSIWQGLDLIMEMDSKIVASYSLQSLNINVFTLIWLQDDNNGDCQ